MSKAKKDSTSLIADNRKARHDYHIHETYEAGIALTGTEVKSIRQGRLNLKDSYCAIQMVKYSSIRLISAHMNRVISLTMNRCVRVNY